MSEPRPQREWRFYIDDMIGFAEKVLSYTDGLDQDDFIWFFADRRETTT